MGNLGLNNKITNIFYLFFLGPDQEIESIIECRLMSHEDYFTLEHDVKFEKESKVAKHIELLNSYEPINHFGDICVTELKIKPDLKEVVDTSLPYLFSAAIEESFGNGVSKQYLLILIKALFEKKKATMKSLPE